MRNNEDPMLKPSASYAWKTRGHLHCDVSNALWGLGRIGFPITDPSSIPDPIRALPRFKIAQIDKTPNLALEAILVSAIDSLEPSKKDDGFYRYGLADYVAYGHDEWIAVREELGLGYVPHKLKSYFGLVPETRNREYLHRRECGSPVGYYNGVSEDSRDYIFARACFPEIAFELCVGASEKNLELPHLDELSRGLSILLKTGLPLTPKTASRVLMEFLPMPSDFESAEMQIIRMDDHIRQQIDNFELEDLTDAARIFFAVAPGTRGTNMNVRTEKVMATLWKGNSFDNVRRTVRLKVVDALAWQLYKFKVRELEPY